LKKCTFAELSEILGKPRSEIQTVIGIVNDEEITIAMVKKQISPTIARRLVDIERGKKRKAYLKLAKKRDMTDRQFLNFCP